MNNIDIRVINLSRRTDRRAMCVEQFALAGINPDSYKFVIAKDDARIPSRGCAASHAAAIAEYLADSDAAFCLVLEDDFSLRDSSTFLQFLELTIASWSQMRWDVFLLAHNRATPIRPTEIPGIYRVINAKTTAGYLVRRDFSPNLICSFHTSQIKLADAVSLPEEMRKGALRAYAPDIYWHRLQVEAQFVAAFPAIIEQRECYSDIEKRVVNYKC